MRISGGKSKGRVIFHDKTGDLRPTSAKVREAVFDIIQSDIVGSRVLDLFSGSGAIGIEALSRGAEEVTFVEINKKRLKKMKDILASFGLEMKARFVCSDSLAFLQREVDYPYDIVFADPPYNYKNLNELVEIIYNKNIVAKDGMLLIEHSTKIPLADRCGNLRLQKAYRYGDTTVSRFKRVSAE